MIEKETILEEVEKMFYTNGIKPVTMDNISMDLKISKRTLYEIFNDKDDLVAQVLQQRLDKINKENKDIIEKSETVIDAIFQIAEHEVSKKQKCKSNPKMMEDLKKYHKEIYSDVYQKITEEIFNTIFKLIERGKAEGLFKKEIETDIIIYTIRIIVNVVEKEPDKFMNKSVKSIHHTLVLPYLIGISTEEGQKQIDNYLKKIIKNKKLHE